MMMLPSDAEQDQALGERMKQARIGEAVWLGFDDLYFIKEDEDGKEPFVCETCGKPYADGQAELWLGDTPFSEPPSFVGCHTCAAAYLRIHRAEVLAQTHLPEITPSEQLVASAFAGVQALLTPLVSWPRIVGPAEDSEIAPKRDEEETH